MPLRQVFLGDNDRVVPVLLSDKEIVTVATTNCMDMLDRAISERPSRFDRVVKLTRPLLEQRRELVWGLAL